MRVYVDAKIEGYVGKYVGKIEFETLEELVNIKRGLEMLRDHKRVLGLEIDANLLEGTLNAFDLEKIKYVYS